MKIIRRTANANGAYPPPQTWADARIPDGYALWPDELDMTDFETYNGFVILNILRGRVASYEVNHEAWEAWKESLPPDPEPVPTDTEVLNTLLGVTDDE